MIGKKAAYPFTGKFETANQSIRLFLWGKSFAFLVS